MMNKRINDLLFGKDGRESFALAIGILLVTILGCLPGANSENALPPEYHGEWKAENGGSILIKPDGTGDYEIKYEGVTQKLTGVTFKYDAEKNTLTYTQGIVSTILPINEPPKNDRMKINDTVYRKNGGSRDSGKNDQLPPEIETQELVKQTLLDWNEAVQTENFENFYHGLSDNYQKGNTPQKFKSAFQSVIDRKYDFSTIKTMDAVFSTKPKWTKRENGKKFLETSGRYNTKPSYLDFKLIYISENDEWKLDLIDTTIQK